MPTHGNDEHAFRVLEFQAQPWILDPTWATFSFVEGPSIMINFFLLAKQHWLRNTPPNSITVLSKWQKYQTASYLCVQIHGPIYDLLLS